MDDDSNVDKGANKEDNVDNDKNTCKNSISKYLT